MNDILLHQIADSYKLGMNCSVLCHTFVRTNTTAYYLPYKLAMNCSVLCHKFVRTNTTAYYLPYKLAIQIADSYKLAMNCSVIK
jgi:hypothetical protein